MAFWLDRFLREDEEDIWKELKQMLKNSDKYEAEKKLQEARELEAFNKAWDKANGVNTESASPKNSKEKLTGMATPVLEGKVVYEKEPSIYEKIDSREDWSDELKAQKKAEVAKIQEDLKAREKEINKEYMLELAKNYSGAALEIGSAAAPGYGGAKLAGTVAKKLAPKVGRKIAQEIATGTLKGASAGTVEGLGRGLLEDKNPLKTAVQDAIVGTTLGAGVGSAGANVQKVVRKSELKKYDNLLKSKKINRQEKNEFIKAGNKYYQDYEQGVETKVKGLGNIKLVSDALKETITQKPEHIIDVLDLSKNLKKAKVLGVESPKHSHKYDITKFHHLGGENVDYQIAENRKGDKYFYKITDPYLTGPKPEGEGLLNTPKSANNIIQPLQNNLNPSQQSIQKPLSHNEWLEELKRRRKKGWW